MQDSASFWIDIKNFEEQLAKSPDSFCFARLSEIYLKVGLIDDALHIARQGVVKHPGYLAGRRVLSLACHAKGLNDEALAALKLVTDAMPEDISSQKLFGRLSAEAGHQDAARQAFLTVLEFEPDDVECRLELESINRSVALATHDFVSNEDDEEIIEDVEIIEELDILEEDQLESEFQFEESSSESDTPPSDSSPHHDPLSTGTLAELYVKQGFIHKALEIYRAILADNPLDRAIAERLVELELLEVASAALASKISDTYQEGAEVESEPDFALPVEAFVQEPEPVLLADLDVMPEPECQKASPDLSWHASAASVVPAQGVADNALTTLDGWLENIRRIKSCR